MKIGTKSVLYGAHCFFIHPWFVALAWWKLFGFPWDPRLWVAFFVHDLGYWGKPNMDGPEGELHPWFGAFVMTWLFDRRQDVRSKEWLHVKGQQDISIVGTWGAFALFHSRFLSKRYGRNYSLLCVADKLAVALEPWWLYLPRVILTGEVEEYMALRRKAGSKYGSEARGDSDPSSRREWQRRMSTYCREWAYAHRDGRDDTWTPNVRGARDDSGTWA